MPQKPDKKRENKREQLLKNIEWGKRGLRYKYILTHLYEVSWFEANNWGLLGRPTQELQMIYLFNIFDKFNKIQINWILKFDGHFR